MRQSLPGILRMREVRIKIDNPLQCLPWRLGIFTVFDVKISHQAQPLRHLLGRLMRLLDELLQLIDGQIEPLIMFGVNEGQLFARFIVKRMFLQMFHVLRGESGRIFDRSSQSRGIL